MRLSLLRLAMTLLVAGCVTAREPIDKPARRPPPGPDLGTLYEPPKAAKREMGALWSDVSPWNSLYSSAENRRIGDVVSVRIESKLRSQIQKMLEVVSPPPTPPTGPTGVQSFGEPTRQPAATGQQAGDTKIRALIQGVQANGVYRVVVADMMKLGTREPYVVFEGNVREQDIDNSGTLSSDAIHNLKLDVFSEEEAAQRPSGF